MIKKVTCPKSNLENVSGLLAGLVRDGQDRAERHAFPGHWSEGLPTAEKAIVVTKFVKQSYKLTYHAALAIISGALNKAIELDLQFCITIVDEAGLLKAFLRMDEGKFLSIETSLSKAVTTASSKKQTGSTQPEVALNLALASHGRVTNLSAGLPLFVDEVCVGAIGVGGATGKLDLEVAEAGRAAFESGLGSTTGG